MVRGYAIRTGSNHYDKHDSKSFANDREENDHYSSEWRVQLRRILLDVREV